jgi:hypothetical protein
MAESFVFPKRMVHLDFHTGPAIPDVGRDFDAASFADTFARAHVDSVTLFAKCHHGHLYYQTQRAERHPGLAQDLGLLEAQMAALHARGIRAPIYISVQCDEYAGVHHPDWVAMDPEGRMVKGGGPLAASWHVLDMSSPYRDYLTAQYREILERFCPVDGIFFDMCWDQPSCSRYALDAMLAGGYDPERPEDRAKYARELVYDYMGQYRAMLDEAQAAAGGPPAGIWFNSRPQTNLAIERRWLRHIEVECLPTGGWGYAFFPYVARFVRPFGLPTLSHTGRFHGTWGDFGGIKPAAALKYECASILSQGMTSGVGDQLPPRGVPDAAAYDLIGEVYAHLQACEPFTEGGTPLSDLAVVIDPAKGDRPGPEGLGIIRALQQMRAQFDLVAPDADFGPYPVVIVSESVPVDEALRSRLEAYVAGGGSLVLSGAAAVGTDGQPALAGQGIACHGPSPFSKVYLRPVATLAEGLPRTDHILHERSLRLTATGEAESLCAVVEPYFERGWRHFCSHGQTPPATLTEYAAIVQCGRVITLAFPVFTAYGRHGNLPYRELLRRCLDRLLPQPLLRDGGPGHLEATVMRTAAATVVHLLSFIPQRRTDGLDLIEDAVPLVDMPLSVRLDAAPRRAHLEPHGVELPVAWADGRAEVRVTLLDGHGLIVLE